MKRQIIMFAGGCVVGLASAIFIVGQPVSAQGENLASTQFGTVKNFLGRTQSNIDGDPISVVIRQPHPKHIYKHKFMTTEELLKRRTSPINSYQGVHEIMDKMSAEGWEPIGELQIKMVDEKLHITQAGSSGVLFRNLVE